MIRLVVSLGFIWCVAFSTALASQVGAFSSEGRSNSLVSAHRSVSTKRGLIAAVIPSQRKPVMVWQKIEIPEMDCYEAHDRFGAFEVPRKYENSIVSFGGASCPNLGNVKHITFIQYLESQSKDSDAEFDEYVKALSEKDFFGQKVKFREVSHVVSIDKMVWASKADIAEPFEYSFENVRVFPSYNSALTEFFKYGRKVMYTIPDDFKAFVEDFINDDNLFNMFKPFMPNVIKVSVIAQHHIVLADGRSYRQSLSPNYERECDKVRCFPE